MKLWNKATELIEFWNQICGSMKNTGLHYLPFYDNWYLYLQETWDYVNFNYSTTLVKNIMRFNSEIKNYEVLSKVKDLSITYSNILTMSNIWKYSYILNSNYF